MRNLDLYNHNDLGHANRQVTDPISSESPSSIPIALQPCLLLPKTPSSLISSSYSRRLATRRRRAADVGELEDMDDTHTLSIPTDLQPVFRNLATLVTPRTTSGSSTRKGRRNTVAVPSSSDDMDTDSDSDSVAKFPLQGKQYPFKFKMMLHKLYELEDWGRKVREVLERSQKEFKPLSEKENIREEGKVATKEDHDVGRVHFRGEFGINSPTKRTGRPPSYTVASSGSKGKGRRVLCLG
ncbi:hypothetical protein BT96DRAFT_701942 [Gymnopus androsaceus JB14]|uniref:Uncharacterized protein n=1 Tax=Gymnopus androsaceus JB14 TaxID=1447944 RepID=A0A6A4HNI8_9AGAR|nr:hypothetical protein BT96DRAFT_701942 [Gymnopus androsaceus JB14]